MHKQSPSALIVDTNYAAIPLINSLQEKGCDVTVVGGYCGKSILERGVRYKDLNYKNTNELRAFILENKFDFIIPGCTDLSYLQCAKLGVTGCETQENISVLHDKKKFKYILTKLRINAAKEIKDKFDQSRSYIVKPVDSYSGRGITILEKNFSEQEKNSALRNAKRQSQTSKAIIEEFISGVLYSVSLYWTGESITNFIIIKEECLSNQFRVDLSYIKDEVDKSINELALKEEIKKLAISMRLSKGIIHFQIINRDGESFFLECMRRLPGDLYSRLVELSSGWKYHCSYLAPFTNELVIDEKSAYRKTNDFLRASVSGLTKDKIVHSIVKKHDVEYEKYVQYQNSTFVRSTYIIPISRSSNLGNEIADTLSN